MKDEPKVVPQKEAPLNELPPPFLFILHPSSFIPHPLLGDRRTI
jgi:hypothetical protein